jgi:hypothetical protein
MDYPQSSPPVKIFIIVGVGVLVFLLLLVLIVTQALKNKLTATARTKMNALTSVSPIIFNIMILMVAQRPMMQIDNALISMVGQYT